MKIFLIGEISVVTDEWKSFCSVKFFSIMEDFPPLAENESHHLWVEKKISLMNGRLFLLCNFFPPWKIFPPHAKNDSHHLWEETNFV